MNCLEFRRICQIDPYTQGKEFHDHKDSCETCEIYFNEAMHFECDLNEALSIPVPEDLESRVILRQSIDSDKVSRHRFQLYSAIAASFVLAVGLILSLYKINETGLDQIALDFYQRNASVLSVSQPLAGESMKGLLIEIGINLKQDLNNIEHVERCYVREKHGVYVVMGGIRGPVTVLFMPEEAVVQRKLFADKTYHGLIIPCPRGSIAIIGEPEEDLEKVESTLHASLEWI